MRANLARARFAMPLRRVMLLLALAGVCVTALALSILYTTFLYTNLYEHVDDRLRGAVMKVGKAERAPMQEPGRAAGETAGPGANDPSAPQEQATTPATEIEQLILRPGRGNPDLAVLVSPSGELTAGVERDGAVERLSAEELPAGLAQMRVGEINSTAFGGDLGNYRLIAGNDTAGNTVILGIPLADTEAIIGDTVQTAIWTTVIVAGGVGTITLLFVRRALRPLEEVASTAASVGRAELLADHTALLERVPPHAADERTEAGRVGAALNRLLSHVTEAFRQRDVVEQRLRVFVADASHELRTPLAAVRGYAEVARLSGEELPPESAHALRRIEQEAERMGTIVADLLLLARLDQQVPLQAEPLDLAPILRDAVADARVAAPDHAVELRLDSAELPVVGDAGQLRQALGNLVSNAWQHTPAGTPVSVSGALHENGRVEVTVHDDGPGLPPALGQRVFERFVRADPSRSRSSGGSGLGLPISKDVVEAHGGTLDVVSDAQGTTFVISLPGPSVRSSASTLPESQGSP